MSRLLIPSYSYDPWKDINKLSLSDVVPGFGDPSTMLGAGYDEDGFWPMDFEASLQEAFFAGSQNIIGCAELARDFGIVLVPLSEVKSSRGRVPSELAARYLFHQTPLSLESLCRANALLGGPGGIRDHPHFTSQYASGHRTKFLPSRSVPAALDKLITKINNVEGVDPVLIAAASMLSLLAIHPFRDANGRTSNLLFQYVLHRHGLLRLPFLPLGPCLQKNRPAFLYALIASSKSGVGVLALKFLLSAARLTSQRAGELLRPHQILHV